MDDELAKAIDAGTKTPTEAVEEILDEALHDIVIHSPQWSVDTLDLARRIVNLLQY